MSDHSLTSRDRYRLLPGDTFALDLGEGQQLRIQGSPAGFGVQTLTAADDGVSIVLDAKGRYALAWRRSDAALRWCPVGTVDVQEQLDETEETYRAQIVFYEEWLSKPEALRVQLTQPSGVSLSRVSAPQVKGMLDRTRAQLEDYLRRKRGLPAARMIG